MFLKPRTLADYQTLQWALYRLFNKNGELLYIGISERPIGRFQEHSWYL